MSALDKLSQFSRSYWKFWVQASQLTNKQGRQETSK